jgi:hypothetical protein
VDDEREGCGWNRAWPVLKYYLDIYLDRLIARPMEMISEFPVFVIV